MKSRRDVLTAGAGLVALAGCADSLQSSGGTTATRDDDSANSEETATTTMNCDRATIEGVDGDWPMYAADAANTGRASSNAKPASEGALAWSVDTFGPGDRPTPELCAADGTLFLAGSGDDSDGVAAVDLRDGTIEWSVATDRYPLGTPATDGDRVYVATQRPNGEDGGDAELLAYSVAGERQWAKSYAVAALQSPTVVDGTVYVTARHKKPSTGDGSLFAVDAASGEEEWSVDVEERRLAPPAVADGTVYTAGRSIYAVDAASGDRQWTKKNAELSKAHFENWATFEAPAVAGDTLLVAGWAAGSTLLLVLDRANGAVRTAAEVPDLDHVRGHPALTDSRVLVASEDGTVALDRSDWSVAWTSTGEASPAAIVGGSVYEFDFGDLVRLDAETGEETSFTLDTGDCSLRLASTRTLVLGDALVLFGDGETYGFSLS